MKKIYVLLLATISLYSTNLSAQASSCANAAEYCTSGNYYYPNVTGVASLGGGGIYGCLGSTPNAKWFYLQVTTAGSMVFTLNQTSLAGAALDLDFVCWGPFTSVASGCTTINDTALGAGVVVSCSYSGSNSETCTITGATVGQYYILLATNFSGQPGVVNIVPNATNTGAAQCTSLCNITAITANPSFCSYPTSTYSVSGQITFLSAPGSGTLVVNSSDGGGVTLNPPFTSPMNYSITGLTASGVNRTITAAFTADPTCNSTQTYMSPQPCLTCFATAGNNGPFCVGSNLNLTVATSTVCTYSWVGPNGFSSTQQNPIITAATAAAAGTYTLTATETATNLVCTSTTNVAITQPPSITVNSPSICLGSNATMVATPNISGGTFLWSTTDTSHAITVNPTTNTSYTVTYTLPGCSIVATDTANVTVTITPTVTCNSTSICLGQSAALTATPSVPGGTYYWVNTHQTTQSIAVAPTATTTYVVFYTLNGCANTAGATVTLITTPIVTANDVNICTGQSGTLSATAIPAGGSYLWAPGGGTTQTIVVSPTVASTYTVTYTSIGCANSGTDTAVVNINSSPSPTPTISQTGLVLTSSSATANQWYLNGTAVTGATNQTITVTQNGVYTVVSSEDGCASSPSAPVSIINIGIEEYSNDYSFMIYPNPTSASSTIYYSLKNTSNVSIEVYTDLGSKVASIVNKQFQSAGDYSYEFTPKQSGIYFIKLFTENGVVVKRLVSNK